MNRTVYPCRVCGRSIVWIRTARGKQMPCDAKAVSYWAVPGGKARVVTEKGDVVAADLDGLPGTASGTGWISHFATCPGADAMRKR